ncbi:MULTISPECIES: hypothetical protein [Cyanophyceae]|uniref:hypothetical protein n=1 Tax=Cyanophyceae TaxID=3028117 RepID=UPI001684F18E|nr:MULTISPECIES: hypothetical protein [Cyanophyceae]MBD1918841.1 hypothetical protein [Phormidium sp. FACHB-77]MBD2033316.1 hypothetical protein [Phormidium sp. FACHB-322]MBD2053751.1 hypothetical protein [Leptolyngbya sp. FACHB-60]
MKNLSEYPQAIATAETAVLRAQQAARALGEQMAARKAEFAHVIAFDKSLTNEAQRKGEMQALEQTDEPYLELQSQHQAAKDAVIEAQIAADLQGRLWQVARLEAESAVVRERRLGALEY